MRNLKVCKCVSTKSRRHQKTEVFIYFCTFLTDIEFRLGANRIISAAAVVNLSNWPSNEDERILYEDEKPLTMLQTLTMSPTLLKEFQKRRESAHCGLHTSMTEHICCTSANDYDNSDYGIIIFHMKFYSDV